MWCRIVLYALAYLYPTELTTMYRRIIQSYLELHYIVPYYAVVWYIHIQRTYSKVLNAQLYAIVSYRTIYFKAEYCRSVGVKKFPDWSQFWRGRGLENAVELSTCKCSFSILQEWEILLTVELYKLTVNKYKNVLENKTWLQPISCFTKHPYLNPGAKVVIIRLRNTKMVQLKSNM